MERRSKDDVPTTRDRVLWFLAMLRLTGRTLVGCERLDDVEARLRELQWRYGVMWHRF